MHRIQCIEYKALIVHAILTQLLSLSNTTKLILAWFTCRRGVYQNNVQFVLFLSSSNRTKLIVAWFTHRRGVYHNNVQFVLFLSLSNTTKLILAWFTCRRGVYHNNVQFVLWQTVANKFHLEMVYFPPFLRNTCCLWHRLFLCGLLENISPQRPKVGHILTEIGIKTSATTY
jgi:hypothetical protein